MTTPQQQPNLTDLVDGTLAGPEWDAWLAAHPREAAQVAEAQQVRALVAQLRAASYDVPADLEGRILERVHGDTAVRGLLQLGLAGLGGALLELLAVVFGLLPKQSDQGAAPRSA